VRRTAHCWTECSRGSILCGNNYEQLQSCQQLNRCGFPSIYQTAGDKERFWRLHTLDMGEKTSRQAVNVSSLSHELIKPVLVCRLDVAATFPESRHWLRVVAVVAGLICSRESISKCTSSRSLLASAKATPNADRVSQHATRRSSTPRKHGNILLHRDSIQWSITIALVSPSLCFSIIISPWTNPRANADEPALL